MSDKIIHFKQKQEEKNALKSDPNENQFYQKLSLETNETLKSIREEKRKTHFPNTEF